MCITCIRRDEFFFYIFVFQRFFFLSPYVYRIRRKSRCFPTNGSRRRAYYSWHITRNPTTAAAAAARNLRTWCVIISISTAKHDDISTCRWRIFAKPFPRDRLTRHDTYLHIFSRTRIFIYVYVMYKYYTRVSIYIHTTHVIFRTCTARLRHNEYYTLMCWLICLNI